MRRPWLLAAVVVVLVLTMLPALAQDATSPDAPTGIELRSRQSGVIPPTSGNTGVTPPSQGQGDVDGDAISVSDDGRWVVFVSTSTDLTTDTYPGTVGNVFLQDRTTGTTTLVSRVPGTTTAGNEDSFDAVLSPDGRFVVFLTADPDVAQASILGSAAPLVLYTRSRDVPGDEPLSTITLDDQTNNQFTCSSPTGVTPMNFSDGGELLVYTGCVGAITGLKPEGTGGDNGVMLFRTANGSSTLLSRVPATNPPDNDNVIVAVQDRAELSRDGSTVIFATGSTAWFDRHAPGWSGAAFQLYRYRVASAAVDVVSGDPLRKVALAPGDSLVTVGGSADRDEYSLSLDGDVVAFAARSSVLTTEPSGQDVFVRDTARLRLASAPQDPSIGARVGRSFSPELSADGTQLVFASSSDDLTTTVDTNDANDIILRDLATRASTLVSRSKPGGVAADKDSTSPVISADGAHVAFVSNATDLVPDEVSTGRTPGPDLFLHEVATDVTNLVSRPTDGRRIGTDAQGRAVFSGDGTRLVFTNASDDLTAGDANNEYDVFDVPAGVTPYVAPPQDLDVIGIEVSQGVQDWANGTTLISGRRTWVRVHVRSVGEPFRTGASLTASRFSDGIRLGTLTPSHGVPAGTAIVDPRPDRESLDQTFVFALPTDWTVDGDYLDQVTFDGRTVRCLDRDRDCDAFGIFRAGPRLDVQLIGVEYTTFDGTVRRPTAAELDAARAHLRRALPVANPNTSYSFDYVPTIAVTPGRTADAIRLATSLAVLRWRTDCDSSLHDDCIFLGVVGGGALGGGISGMASATPGNAAWAVTGGSNKEALDAAHEVGHLLGRRHVNCGGTKGIDPDYPYPNNQRADPQRDGPEYTDWGLDLYLRGRDGRASDDNVMPPTGGGGDLMSYCLPTWPSYYTYNALDDALGKRFGHTPTTSRATTSRATPERVILVVGHRDGDDAVIDVVEETTGVPTLLAGTGATVRIEDAAATVLATETFALPEPDADTAGVFVVALPAPAGAAAVSIVTGASQTDRVMRTSTPPTVSALRLESSTDDWVLSWTTGDADGDDVTAGVDYSRDGGATWRPLTDDVASDRLTVDTTLLAGTTTGRFRVRVSDGWDTATATSDAFSIPGHSPEITIDPVPPHLRRGQSLSLHATAFDREDGLLDDVIWTSDRDGRIASRADATIATDDLQPGRHTITATVTDADGVSAAVSTTMLVIDGVTRLAGDTRITTAIEVSRALYGDGTADVAVVARSDNFADALAGGPLAVQESGPLLLTPPDGLAPEVATELTRVLPPGSIVHLLGGPVALSEGVADAVAAAGFVVRRHAGADRYATAVAIADELTTVDTIFLADGQKFPDALAASAVAGANRGAVLLTAGETLPDATITRLASHTGAVIAVGGPAARAAPQADGLIGDDRFATAVMLADRFAPRSPTVAIASGVNFPDALAGGVQAALEGAPLLLSRPDAVPEATAASLRRRQPDLTHAWLYGGVVALDDDVLADVHTAAGLR